MRFQAEQSQFSARSPRVMALCALVVGVAYGVDMVVLGEWARWKGSAAALVAAAVLWVVGAGRREDEVPERVTFELGGKRSGGFTLIEVMITVAITALLFSMIGGILLSVVNASEKVEKKLRTEKLGYGVLTTLRRDLTGVYAYALGGPAFKGEDHTEVGHDADILNFVTTARVLRREDGTFPRYTEVGYKLDANDNDSLTLFRRAAELEGDPLTGPEGYVEIATGIESFNVEYLDPEDQQWKDRWDQPDLPLPLAVKLSLALALDPREQAAAEQSRVELPPRIYEMVVGIPAERSPKEDEEEQAPPQ